jgi:outer membrane protein TolC
MRSLIPLASLGLTLALVLPASGQDAGEPLTLGAALDEAFTQNPEIIALRRQYEAAFAVSAQERHLGAPTLEAQIWGWPVTTVNPVDTEMYMFMMEQALPGRGKRAARALVAERDADVVRSDISIRANEVLDEVRQAYAELALARDTLVLYDRQLSVLRDTFDAATLQFASGHGGQHDTVLPLVALAELESDALTWRARARTAGARLNTLLGRPVDRPVDPLLPMVWTAMPFDPAQAALERHPAMAAATATIAREQAELDRLRGERRPDFMVGGGYMLTPGDAGAWTVRGGLTWPNAPWSRGRLDAAIDVQARRVEAAGARREAIAAGIRRGVFDAVVRIETARERAALIQKTLLPHAEHGVDVSRVAYAAGSGSFADILGSQRAWLSAEMDLVAAQTEVALALASLDYAIGAVRDEARPAVVVEVQP